MPNGFKSLPVAGFVNDGKSGKRTCDEQLIEGQVGVEQSFHLDDDLLDVAKTLKDHPMIVYPESKLKLPYEEMIATCWARLAGSSIWLEKYQLYLSVTRVIFFDKNVRHWPVISFLRGQLYDENWKELKNHTIRWHGDDITFPTVFTIPAPYEKGGGFYGPEDPRIIIEEGVEDAEPIVSFNMIYELDPLRRAMHLFRPFSNATVILTMSGQMKRPETEKNWAPFFYYGEEKGTTRSKQWPSHYIHFVHGFDLFKVIKCHSLNGWCDVVYEQKITKDLAGSHDDSHGRMSGGTNLVPVPLPSSSSVRAYVGFPRTHTEVGCKDAAMYRPELMVMTVQGSDFHLNYMSEPLDFEGAAMSQEATADPCGDGRILIANSIARWDRSRGQDLMTLAFSVADTTVQILRLQGIGRYIEQMPLLDSGLHTDMSQDDKVIWNLRWSAVGMDILTCSVEAASNYSRTMAEPMKGLSREKLEEAMQKTTEQLLDDIKKQESQRAEAARAVLQAEKEKGKEKQKQKEKEQKEPADDGAEDDEELNEPQKPIDLEGPPGRKEAQI